MTKRVKKMVELESKIREREVEMRGFSGGEILKGRYPLVWWKVRCYECGGLGHRRRDHGEIRKEKIEKDEIEKKKEKKKKKKSEKRKREKREIGI